MSEKPKTERIRRTRRRLDDEGGNEAVAEAPETTAAEVPPVPECALHTALLAAHADPVAMGDAAAAVPISSHHNAAASSAVASEKRVGEDVFDIAYDSYAPKDLYALLRRFTRQEVERRMADREQSRRRQQEGPRMERFLDVIAATRAGTGSGAVGYEYTAMLRHLYAALNRNKENSALTERNQVPEPRLERLGKKKVIISNFARICQAVNRPIEDVKDYIEKELSVPGNLDSSNALILKYEIQKATAFDNIITRYLDEFVKCNSCRRIDTTLTKEDRRMELRCNWCTATRTVQAVGSATYSAQVGKRSKARLQGLLV